MQAAAAIWMASLIAPWVMVRFGRRVSRLTAWIVLILAAILIGLLLYLAADRLLHPGCRKDDVGGFHCPPGADFALTLLGPIAVPALSALLKLRTLRQPKTRPPRSSGGSA